MCFLYILEYTHLTYTYDTQLADISCIRSSCCPTAGSTGRAIGGLASSSAPVISTVRCGRDLLPLEAQRPQPPATFQSDGLFSSFYRQDTGCTPPLIGALTHAATFRAINREAYPLSTPRKDQPRIIRNSSPGSSP